MLTERYEKRKSSRTGVDLVDVYIKELKKYYCELSWEEESKLVFLATEHNDEEAKKKLLEHNLALVVGIATKFINACPDLLQLIEFGNEGLFRAIEKIGSFRRESRFQTFAYTSIVNSIKDNLKKERRYKMHLSHEEFESEYRPSSQMKTPLEILEEKEKKENLEMALDCLDKEQKELISLKYPLDENKKVSTKEMSEKTGLNKNQIMGKNQRSLQKLRFILAA